MYTYKVINKTTDSITDVSYKILSHKNATVKLVSNTSFTIPEQGIAEGTLFIELPMSAVKKDKIKIEVGVFSNGKMIETTTTNFLGPRTFR